MKYERIIFLKRNNELVGIGIQKDGIKRLLTLNEAIKEASILKKADKENAIEFLNTKRKVDRARVEINNEKPKKKRIPAKGVAAIAVAVALAGTAGTYALTKSLDGDARLTATTAQNEGAIVLDQDAYEAAKNNNVVNDRTYEDVTEEEAVTEAQADFNKVLNASESQTQIEYVTMMSDYIRYFNIDFADTYAEMVDGIEVKPALSWNYEIPALTIAYNDLSKREILEIFNGVELNANTLDANYKNGTLQLFGAYVISDSSKPVRLYDLIESEEGKEFVKKYENMFYAIKDAKTEAEKIELVEKFYSELYKDFPIDSEVRENGISHIDARALMDNASYKLAITPMVTATEVMYQNLDYDKTLSSKAIKYFNDLGMCNIAYEKFQKAEFVLEDSSLNEKYADFGQLSKIIINELKQRGSYVIDDQHRDLSKLTRFQQLVNGHFNINENGYFDGSFDMPYGGGETTKVTHKRIKVAEWTETKITKKHETKTTKTSDRDEAVKKAGEKKVKEAENKVKEQIDKENNEAREKAEKEADQKQKEEQAKEDQKAKEKEQEAQEANEQVQEDIKDINDKINENNKDNDKTNDTQINENDYNGIDFDDNHSDEHGNLDDSVKDVTTDGTGANKPLPNPEDTGKKFDEEAKSAPKAETKSEPKAEAPKAETKSEPKSEPKAEAPKTETKSEPKAEPKKEEKPNLPDPNETGKEFDEKANQELLSNDQLVNLYIERMVNSRQNTKAHVKVLKR